MSLDVYLTRVQPTEVFWANITHNLTEMADKAGIYKALWRPEEIGIKRAQELTPILEKGLRKLKANPDYYKQFNSPNSWGKYENFVEFCEEYLEACRKFPDAEINVSR